MTTKNETVVLLGASSNPERYAYKALSLLLEKGHNVIPINPKEKEILGQVVKDHLNKVTETVDTLTIYLSPKISESLINDMLAINPKRVIMNPGTESDKIEEAMNAHGVEVVKGCTIVMLKTGQY